MPENNNAYPAVKAEIDGRIMRFDNLLRLTKAVRRGDIKNNSRVIYEESPNSITEMRAADCPMLTDILAQFAEPEAVKKQRKESPEEPDKIAVANDETAVETDDITDETEEVPTVTDEAVTDESDAEVTPQQISTDFNAIRTGDDMSEFEDIYAPKAYRNNYSGDLGQIFTHEKARFWLIPDPKEGHKSYLVPGSEVLTKWSDYGLSATENPLKHHFDLLEGDRMRLRRPAVMVQDGGEWALLKKGTLEGIAAGGGNIVSATRQAEPEDKSGEEDTEPFIIEQEQKPEKKGFRNAMIIIGLLAALGIAQVYKSENDTFEDDTYEVDAQAPNICTGTAQGYVNQDMVDRAELRYLDRDTNIRAQASGSGRRVGRADRAEQFWLRRASDASSENWYQITAGPNCGHYVYSYADVPPKNRPPAFAQYINEVRTVETDATMYDRPNGTGIGSVAAGSDISLIGNVNDGFAEVIDPAQDNLLGYVEMAAFEKPPEQFTQAGLTIINTCSTPVRVYLQADAVGLQVKGYTQMRAGENINVTNGRGREVMLTSNVVQFYSEADTPRMSASAIRRWSPATSTVTANMAASGNYELYAGCSR